MPHRLPHTLPPRLIAPLRPTFAAPISRRHAHSVAIPSRAPVVRRALTQPESHKTALARKTQLHRSYLSLIRSSPLLLIFQHNNLRAIEWTALRRELRNATNKIASDGGELAALTKITLIRSALFSSALRVAEGFDKAHPKESGLAGTSKEAYAQTLHLRDELPLNALLTGPTATLSFPVVSPPHLKVVLDIMFPAKGHKRGLDPLAVSGLQKLVLLGARVDGHVAGGRIGEGRVLDGDQVRLVSGLKGIEDMRGELAAILQSVGGGELVRSLGSVGLGIVRTVEGRRKIMEEEANGGAKTE